MFRSVWRWFFVNWTSEYTVPTLSIEKCHSQSCHQKGLLTGGIHTIFTVVSGNLSVPVKMVFCEGGREWTGRLEKLNWDQQTSEEMLWYHNSNYTAINCEMVVRSLLHVFLLKWINEGKPYTAISWHPGPRWPPHFNNFHILSDLVKQAKLDIIHHAQLHYWTSCLLVKLLFVKRFKWKILSLWLVLVTVIPNFIIT